MIDRQGFIGCVCVCVCVRNCMLSKMSHALKIKFSISRKPKHKAWDVYQNIHLFFLVK